MDFIDEEDDLFVRADFIHQLLHPFFELATDAGSLDERDDIQADHFFIQQFLRDIAVHDLLGEAFHHGCFADAGFPCEHRVVFCATIQDFDDAGDFAVPADDRVDASVARQLRQVDAVFVQQAAFAAAFSSAGSFRGRRLLVILFLVLLHLFEEGLQITERKRICGALGSRIRIVLLRLGSFEFLIAALA